MIRLCAILLWLAVESLVKVAADLVMLGIRKLVGAIRRRRTRRAMRSWEGHHLDEVAENFNTETGMKTWLQSRTIQGLIASGTAAVLGWFLLDADAGTLGAQLAEWLLQGVQLGGLIYAARGRKLASGPLA